MKITIWIQVKKEKVNAIYVNKISLKRCRCNQTMETKQTDIISLKKTLYIFQSQTDIDSHYFFLIRIAR